ncbi:hypothetical protein CMI42_06580 [Candidatus Pacearchaeota archaeon]|nr:hypothetical protein [Candidatus Pacearchaeota archaeon]|tara:strand:+ start:170 stop:556 length:387 start_codon:yes stop_codon:yes gene_type:complete
MQDEIKEVYYRDEDISEIIEKLRRFSFDDLVKTDHFYYSLDEKRTDVEMLKENFRNFEKVKLINKRQHKNKEISYDFYYELDFGYLVYAITFGKTPILINGYHAKRNFSKVKEAFLRDHESDRTKAAQ